MTCFDNDPNNQYLIMQWTKGGKPRKVNQFPAVCVVCGDHLLPGEAIVGSMDQITNRIRWTCGPGRWRRGQIKQEV
jgi:hypothetical protein